MDKVKPSINIILKKFLREIIALNIKSAIKTNEIIVRKGNAINHSNYYLVINNIIDVLKLI